MPSMILKKFSKPDETRPFGHGKVEIVNLGDSSIALATFEPGWRWDRDVKPIAGTESCEVAHDCYVISGRMRITMNDGQTLEMGPGDCVFIPPGHQAESAGGCVCLDFAGMHGYALPIGATTKVASERPVISAH